MLSIIYLLLLSNKPVRQFHHFTDVETGAQKITCPRSQEPLMGPEFKPRPDQLQSHDLHHSALLCGLCVYPYTLGSRLLEGGGQCFFSLNLQHLLNSTE